MPISCNPQDLIGNASQFCCITGETAQAVKLYLLRHIAGLDDMTPQQLLAASSCWMGCVSSGAYKAVEAYLLCQIANSGGTPTVCAPQEGADSPVGAAVPAFIGQLYHETGDDTYWRSTGLTNADWTEISGGGASLVDAITYNGGNGTDLTSTVTQLTGDFYILESSLVSLSMPDLVDMMGSFFGFEDCADLATVVLTSLSNVAGDIEITGCPSLGVLSFPALTTLGGAFSLDAGGTSVLFPVLTSVGDDLDTANNGDIQTFSVPSLTVMPNAINLGSCSALSSVDFSALSDCISLTLNGASALPTLSLPQLVTCPNIDCGNCTSLASVTAPNFVPQNGDLIIFFNCALDETSVDNILHRAVLAGMASGTIDLSGGTNATPSVAGQADAAALTLAGCTVTTN